MHMKISTNSMKMFALAAGMMLAVTQSGMAKWVTPNNYTTNALISKVFYAGAKDTANKNYANGKYVELYNCSTDTLDMGGVMLGLVESDSKTYAWTTELLTEQHKDSLAVKQIFRLPAGTKMDPFTSLLIVNSAIDHSVNGDGFPNLSNADFEAKDASGKVENNADVPAIELIYSAYASISNMNLVQSGPCSVLLIDAKFDIENMKKTFQPGKDKGNEYVLVPRAKVIDGVEIAKQTEESVKRLSNAVDSGYVAITSKTGWNGEVVYRNTAYVVGGKVVYFDTNDSRRDWKVSAYIQPRQFDAEPAGLTEQTITIPASGYLAVNINKPFCSGKDLVFAYVNVTNNAATTDMTYGEFPGDSTLLIKGPWIAIGQPGEHTILLSESQGVMKTRSSGMTWCDEDSKTLTGSSASKMIYKFTATEGKVGFQRVEAVGGKYNQATFSDGDRLYYAITEAIADKIAAKNGATNHADLDFIQWHGTTPAEVAAGIGNAPRTENGEEWNNAVYDLQGRRVSQPTRGLYIVNGKKIIVK